MWMHNKLNIFYKRCQDRVVLAFFAVIYPDKLLAAGGLDTKVCERICQWQGVCIPKYAIKAAGGRFYVCIGVSHLKKAILEAIGCVV